jgi:hypothetical protein
MKLQEGVDRTRALLRRAGRRPAVVGHDVWIASGLEQALPETVLMCLQGSPAIEVLRARGIEVFCLTEHAPPEEVAGKSSLDLLQHPATRAFAQTTDPLALMVFKPNERLVAAAEGLGALLIGGDPRAARRAENKIAFMEMATQAGISVPRWEARPCDETMVFAELADQFGEPFVVQGARGNAGRRTYLVETDADLAQARAREDGKVVRIAAYARGVPFTATGLSGSEAVHNALWGWIEPCRQVTGVDWLTGDALGSCGNVWGDGAIDGCAAQAGKAVAAIAGQLAASGYAGMFGVDFVCADDAPRVIEVNPRMVASIPIATQMAIAAERAPLLMLQLLQGLGDMAALGGWAEGLSASQLIIHALAGDALDGVQSGVYQLTPGASPQYLREGCWLTDLQSDDEALLLTRSADEPRTAGKEVARIYLKSAAGENQPGLRELVSRMRAA